MRVTHRRHCLERVLNKMHCGGAVFILAILFPQACSAQTPGISGINVVIKRISTEQGLSSSMIWAITQDTRGFVWIGTDKGLNKFDGKNFKTYTFDPHDSSSLSDPQIWSLFADSSGILWVGTQNGLNRFDPATLKFSRYFNDPKNDSSLSNNEVRSIYRDRAGVLWVGTARGLNRFHEQTGAWTRYLPAPNDSSHPGDNFIDVMLEDHQGSFWIGTGVYNSTGGGLYRFDRKSERCRRWGPIASTQNPNGGWVTSILEDRSGDLWVSYDADGVEMLDRSSDCFRQVALHWKGTTNQFPRFIKTVCEDSTGAIWIATWGSGLYRYSRPTGTLIQYTVDVSNPGSLSNPAINTLYVDRAGLLWVGTYGGLNTVATKPFFPRYSVGDSIRFGSRVDGLLADRHGNLWVDAIGIGLWRYDIRTQRSTHVSPNAILDHISEDSEGTVWIGTGDDQLYRYEPERDLLTYVATVPVVAGKRERVAAVLHDTRGSLWVGTYEGSLYNIPKSWKNVSVYVHNSLDPKSITAGWVYSIVEDRSGSIWVGTEEGLNRFDRETQSFIRFAHDDRDTTSLSDDHACRIFEDRSGTLWIGTVNGLNRFNRATSNFSRFFADQPQNRSVGRILEDDKGCLWYASGQGISMFNPADGSFTSYDQSDGLERVELQRMSCAKLASGEMLFGITNGIVVFHPESVQPLRYVPPVIIAGIKKFNQPIKLTTASEILREVTFQPGENVFSIEYAALSYDMPQYNQYAYKLEGFDRDWVYCGNRQEATYTNLDPGAYTFRVKGSNHDGIWNEAGVSLNVIIVPPWWKTTWAYILYILAITSIVYGMYRYRIDQMRLKHQVQIEHLEAENVKALEHAKSRFFANISHEFRTPLTLILGPAEELQSVQPDEASRNKLSMLHRNAQRLLRLINQLLDLSKIDAGGMKLQTTPGNIVPFVKGIAQSFESSAGRRGVALNVETETYEIELYFDQDKMEKILTNLVSNALKFTPEGGAVNVRVALSASGTADSVDVIVEDTGIGIPEEELPHIFDRFYQVDASQTREQDGTGIGLALTKELVEMHHGTITVKSEVGKGTEFTVSFPLGKEHLRPEEIVDVSQERQPSIREENAAVPSEGESIPLPLTEEQTQEQPLVLIVEDNADVRKYIRGYLAPTYQVFEARDGAEGVEKARDSIPDLIISDVMMPKMDGYALCRTLKLDEKTSHVPVILLTAKAGQENKIEGLETGADDYLTKPFEAKELLVRVKNLIDLRRKLRERFSVGQVLKPGEIAVTSVDDAFLRKVMGIVEQRLGEESFSVEDLAGEAGMSRSQLHRKLTALSGQSPSDFIRYMRLHRAMELLKKNAGAVSEIAYTVGFSGVSYFTKCFKDQFGTLPSEVQKTT